MLLLDVVVVVDVVIAVVVVVIAVVAVAFAADVCKIFRFYFSLLVTVPTLQLLIIVRTFCANTGSNYCSC